jgi:predicted lysophospholipase L1 biosynthesis ABC-type transport system permease subunit
VCLPSAMSCLFVRRAGHHRKFSVAERELVADRCRDVEAGMRGMDNKPAGKRRRLSEIRAIGASRTPMNTACPETG